MAIDIGDAVLTFLGDTSQLDQTFARVGTEVPAKMAPATAAIQGTSGAVQEMSRQMAVGQQGAVELGTVTNLAGEKVRESMYQARGEAGLLGEAFGIHLPRHVRSFIAELPGVGSALSAAFQATAVLFIIEAVAQLVEKIIKFAEAQKVIEEAWKGVDKAQEHTFHGLEDNLIRAQVKTAELTGNHLEALRLKLQLIDNTTLGKLDAELEKLAKLADDAFKKMDRSWFSQFFLGLEGGDAAKDKFKSIQESVSQALDERTPEAFTKALGDVNKGVADTALKLGELAKKQADFENSQKNMFAGRGSSRMVTEPVDPNTIASWEKLNTLLQGYKKDIAEAQKADDQEKKNAGIEERNKQLAVLAQNAKRDLEARLAGIEQEKATQHAAFAAGTIDAGKWAEAQIKAANDSAKAQDDYKDKLAELAKKGSDGSKALAASQDAATEKTKQQNKLVEEAAKAIEKAKEETSKLRAEWEKGIFKAAKVTDTAKALDELTRAENKYAEAGKSLALAQISKDFTQQEAAIKKLSQFKIITQQQEADQLRILYAREEDDALKALRKRQQDELKEMLSANAKFQAATEDALFPPAQLAELKKNLDLAMAAYLKTQTEITKVQQDAQNKDLAQSRNYYAVALALAISSGNRQLTERLRENHAMLLSAQAQLADAKARGADTAAIEKQIKALQKLEKELAKDAGAEKKAHVSSLSQFAQLSKALQAYEAELDRSGSKAAAWGATVGTVISAVAQAYAQGGVTIQQALAQVAAAEIQAIAQIAEKKGTVQLAEAFGSWPDGVAMAHHFAAAALWFSLAGGLSMASGALSGGGGGTSKSSATSAGSNSPASVAPGSSQQPVMVQNIQHFASGALVSRPTLAIVGDAAGGGSAREGILPLDDRRAMAAIAEAIAAHMGNEPIEIRLSGDIPQIAQCLSHGVKTGRVRLVASDSIRHTRRS